MLILAVTEEIVYAYMKRTNQQCEWQTKHMSMKEKLCKHQKSE